MCGPWRVGITISAATKGSMRDEVVDIRKARKTLHDEQVKLLVEKNQKLEQALLAIAYIIRSSLEKPVG